MAEHYFTAGERRGHLEMLATALDDIVSAAEQSDVLKPYANELERAASRTRELLAAGFTQPDLTELANTLPDPLGMRGNPRWEPHLQQAVEGRWIEADWFAPIELKLEAVSVAVRRLRTVGYY
jgi:hypothetical protein